MTIEKHIHTCCSRRLSRHGEYGTG